jgi:protein-S-isoprenylcysteine O-methyltransferase Ste14
MPGFPADAGLLWLGVPMMVAGLWLFWRSHTDLGKCWSVTLKLNQDHELIVKGVYQYMRHPMYASFFLLAISQALLLNNWLAGGAAFPAVALLYLLRVPNEEKMMMEHFGEEYLAYRRNTNALFPFRSSQP